MEHRVLDNTVSSGTNGVACVNTNRNLTGIELDASYFRIAEERIAWAERLAEAEPPRLAFAT